MFDFLPETLRLSLFPELLSWWGLAPFFFRLVIAFVSVKEGLAIRRSPHRLLKIVAYGEIITAIFILLGFQTQLSALVLAFLSFSFLLLQKQIRPLTPAEKHYRLLHISICLSLLFLGPGFWSIDLQL